MTTIFDYVDWRGDLTFAQSELNEVDALILSMISYVDFDEIIGKDGDDDFVFRGFELPLRRSYTSDLRRIRYFSVFLRC